MTVWRSVGCSWWASEECLLRPPTHLWLSKMMAFSGQQDPTWSELEKRGAYAAIFTISGTRSMPILKAASAIASCRAAGTAQAAGMAAAGPLLANVADSSDSKDAAV